MTAKEIQSALIDYYKELVALGADREAVAIKEFLRKITN